MPSIVHIEKHFTSTAAVRDISSEVLSSARVEPGRLLASGFEFDHPTLHDRLVAALG